jgi:hypothetical protein
LIKKAANRRGLFYWLKTAFHRLGWELLSFLIIKYDFRQDLQDCFDFCAFPEERHKRIARQKESGVSAGSGLKLLGVFRSLNNKLKILSVILFFHKAKALLRLLF